MNSCSQEGEGPRSPQTHKPTWPWTLICVLCLAFWHLYFDNGAPSKSHSPGTDAGLCLPASPWCLHLRKAVRSLGVAASRERAHLLSAAEVFGSILNIQSRSVTSEWEDTSLASWSGLRKAYSSGTLVLQLVTCNLESFF